MQKINLGDMLSDDPGVKYPCSKLAIAISQEAPASLYDDLDFFVALLTGDNKIMKWTALQVIGNLAKIDMKAKIDMLIPQIVAMLSDKTMITAVNAIETLGEIAISKPKYQEIIVSALLDVENVNYYIKNNLSPECRNVALGHVINALEKLGSDVYGADEVRQFLSRQIHNTRPTVSRHAKELLEGCV
jgi:hypothetical protein